VELSGADSSLRFGDPLSARGVMTLLPTGGVRCCHDDAVHTHVNLVREVTWPRQTTRSKVSRHWATLPESPHLPAALSAHFDRENGWLIDSRTQQWVSRPSWPPVTDVTQEVQWLVDGPPTVTASTIESKLLPCKKY